MAAGGNHGRRALFAAAAAIALAGPATADAQAPGYDNVIGSPSIGGAPPASSRSIAIGGDVPAAPPAVGPTSKPSPVPAPAPRPPADQAAPKPRPLARSCTVARRHGRTVRTCRFLRGGRLVKRCVTKGGTRRCAQRANGRIIRRCVKPRGKPERCRVVRSVATGAIANGPARPFSPEQLLRGRDRARVAAARYSSGYTNPLLAPVVRFYYSGSPGATKGWCSGTLLLRGIVLTAAHCLYANPHDGKGQLGYYPRDQMTVVPGNYWDAGRNMDIAPYGNWKVAQTYVPQGWANNDGGMDWGIAVLAPDANGGFPGDITGTYGAEYGARFPFGSRLFRVGYPASGPFGTAQYFYGGGQYFCDMRWDGETWSNDPYIASSYNMATSPCEMNGGCSGGPVFVQKADGSWAIVAVNNRGTDRADGFGQTGIASYFDNRFGDFWNGVIGGLRGTASLDGVAAPT